MYLLVAVVATFLASLVFFRARMRSALEGAQEACDAKLKSQGEVVRIRDAQLDEIRHNQERMVEELNRARNDRAMEQQRRSAAEEKLNQALAARENQVAEFQARLDKEAGERHRLEGDIAAEQGRRAQFEAAVADRDGRIDVLERRIRELEERLAEIPSLQERLKSREDQLADVRQAQARATGEGEKLKSDLMAEIARRSAAEERLNRLVLLETQLKDLDARNTVLLRENAELTKTRERLDKLEELKDVYARTLEENLFLKQQNMARSFLEIRKGLEKALQAYNKTYGQFDQRVVYTLDPMVEQLGEARAGELRISDTRFKAEEAEPERIDTLADEAGTAESSVILPPEPPPESPNQLNEPTNEE